MEETKMDVSKYRLEDLESDEKPFRRLQKGIAKKIKESIDATNQEISKKISNKFLKENDLMAAKRKVEAAQRKLQSQAKRQSICVKTVN